MNVLNGSFTVLGAPASSPPSSCGSSSPPPVLADAVRDVLEDVEPADALLLEQVDGVRVALPRDGDQHVAGVELRAARPLHVPGRALQDPLEGGRLLGILRGAEGFQRAVQVLLELALEQLEIGAAREQHLGGHLVTRHRVQEVLERDVLVPSSARLRDRGLKSLL